MSIYTIIVYLIAATIMLWRIIRSTKAGFAKELRTAVSIGIALLVGFILKNIVLSFSDGKYGRLIGYIALLSIILIAYKLVKIILTSLKLFASLPVIRLVDKLLGIVLGIVEGFVIILFLISLFKGIIIN